MRQTINHQFNMCDSTSEFVVKVMVWHEISSATCPFLTPKLSYHWLPPPSIDDGNSYAGAHRSSVKKSVALVAIPVMAGEPNNQVQPEICEVESPSGVSITMVESLKPAGCHHFQHQLPQNCSIFGLGWGKLGLVLTFLASNDFCWSFSWLLWSLIACLILMADKLVSCNS